MAAAVTLAFAITFLFLLIFVLAKMMAWVTFRQRVDTQDIRSTLSTLAAAHSVGEDDIVADSIETILGQLDKNSAWSKVVPLYAVMQSSIDLLGFMYPTKVCISCDCVELKLDAKLKWVRTLLTAVLRDAVVASRRAGEEFCVRVVISEDKLTVVNRTTTKEDYPENETVEQMCQKLNWQISRNTHKGKLTTELVWNDAAVRSVADDVRFSLSIN